MDWVVFTLTDHRFHVFGNSVVQDAGRGALDAALAAGTRFYPPVDGAVYGSLLNDRATLDAMGDALTQPPHNAPPRAPVLYLKPRNTRAGYGAAIAVPNTGVEVGASVGVVIGRTASHVAVTDAAEYVAGYVAVADLCVPHASVYRPVIPLRARDGFCVMGPAAIARRHVGDPDALPVSVSIDAKPVFAASTSTCVRGVAQLLADVTEFMTLAPGDVLTLGAPHGAPVAHAGALVEVRVAGWAPLRFTLVAEPMSGGVA